MFRPGQSPRWTTAEQKQVNLERDTLETFNANHLGTECRTSLLCDNWRSGLYGFNHVDQTLARSHALHQK